MHNHVGELVEQYSNECDENKNVLHSQKSKSIYGHVGKVVEKYSNQCSENENMLHSQNWKTNQCAFMYARVILHEKHINQFENDHELKIVSLAFS